MEIETAVRLRALESPGITNLTGRHRVYKFQLPIVLEGTGHCAVVFRRNTGWASPGPGGAETPIVVADCYADHSRNEQGEQIKDDREERAMQLFREVDRWFHQKAGGDMYWPSGDTSGLRVFGCFRGSEPAGPIEREGVAMVRVTYDVLTAH